MKGWHSKKIGTFNPMSETPRSNRIEINSNEINTYNTI